MHSILWVYLCIGLIAASFAANVTSETKEKRQIHQTGIASSQHNQDIHRQLDAIYGSTSPYLVRAPAPKGQQRGQPQVHYQQQPQLQEIQFDQAQALQGAQYAYYPEFEQQNAQGHVQVLQQPQETQYYAQSADPREQQIHSLREEQLFKLLQQELAVRGTRPEHSPAQTQQKLKAAASSPGLGSYRAPAEAGQKIQYIQYPQNYVQAQQLDYHRAVPNHPLAQSSLEKEIEKLIASNKPNYQQSIAQESYRSPKQPAKLVTTTLSPVSDGRPYPDVPDYLQLNAYKGPFFYQQNLAEPTPLYPTESPQQQKFKLINKNAGQYLVESGVDRPKHRSNHSPFHQQYYSGEVKATAQSQSISSQEKPNSVQYTSNPAAQYQQSELSSPADAVAYYTSKPQQQVEKARPQLGGQSHSAIYVAQGTGVTPLPHQQQLVQQQPIQQKAPQKAIPKLPEQGKVITEAEFQALVDAGYPVEAVHVPVPVPVQAEGLYKTGPPPPGHLFRAQGDKGFRRQVKPASVRPGVTYLRPLQVNPELHGRPTS